MEAIEYWRKKLTVKQQKAIDSLSYCIEWTRDTGDKPINIFLNSKVRLELIYQLANKKYVEKEDLIAGFQRAFWAKYEYERFENGIKVSNFYDIVMEKIDDIFLYVDKTVNNINNGVNDSITKT